MVHGLLPSRETDLRYSFNWWLHYLALLFAFYDSRPSRFLCFYTMWLLIVSLENFRFRLLEPSRLYPCG